MLSLTDRASRQDSGLTGMWVGTHQIDSSTEGPQSFNSQKCGTFCKIIESNGQITGSITLFGLNAKAFRDTEGLRGTVNSNAIAWKSGRSWQDANKKPQEYQTSFHGTRNGDLISGQFEETCYDDGKTVTYSGTVELKPAYSLDGRFVVNGYDGNLWTNRQQIRFSSIVPEPALKAPDAAGRLAEFEKFLQTPEGRLWQQARHDYDVEADGTGAFKIEGVPPGSYQLDVNLYEDRKDGAVVPVAALSTQIDVPGGHSKTNRTINLGSLELTLKTPLKLEGVAPSFEFKTVDGQLLRLADYRGKYVLLDFWATWCGPCVAEVPFLKATYAAFGTNAHFAMISLSVDDAPGPPKNFARKNGVNWTQGFLGKLSDSTVTPLYRVEGVPAIFLIGPDGKIIAEDLRGDAIREAVGKALGKADGKE